MDTFFLVILGFLALLAAIDLFVGVSNDASNFLNSAVGCRIAPYKVLVAVAGLGILLGATFSGGASVAVYSFLGIHLFQHQK